MLIERITKPSDQNKRKQIIITENLERKEVKRLPDAELKGSRWSFHLELRIKKISREIEP